MLAGCAPIGVALVKCTHDNLALRPVDTLAGVAILRHVASGREYFLSPRHLIGRAPTSHVRVQDASVSGFHAEVIWDGKCWYIQDLGSRNGTSLGSHVLAAGERAALRVGCELVLAGRIRFCLVDDRPPHVVATSQSGEVRLADHELLCLPHDDAPEVTIYRDLDGQWLLESATQTRVIDGETSVHAGGETWQVTTPNVLPHTREIGAAQVLCDMTFEFAVSRDGEHVELQLTSEQSRISLESRVHLSLLLLLARERHHDICNRNLPEPEQGWVYNAEIPRQLDIEPQQVYLWIHRARKQLARAGIIDAAGIVERRVATGQIRLGARKLLIVDR